MSDLRGGALYVYVDDLRWGVIETDLGPGCYDLVAEHYEEGKWVESGRLRYMSIDNIIGVAEAVKFLAAWEGEIPPKQTFEVTVRFREEG